MYCKYIFPFALDLDLVYGDFCWVQKIKYSYDEIA